MQLQITSTSPASLFALLEMTMAMHHGVAEGF
jgi:hypothetical protein